VSVKKLLCNPPAQRIAESGDPEVRGMFEGAGDVLRDMDPAFAWFDKAVVDVEERYMESPKAHAANTAREMKALYDRAVDQSTGGGITPPKGHKPARGGGL
jgi:hypothetical protein